MGKIDHLVVRSTASEGGKPCSRPVIERRRRSSGSGPAGCYYIIQPDGGICKGRDIPKAAQRAAGHKGGTIDIYYAGGRAPGGQAADTRTGEQKAALYFLLQNLKEQYPGARIIGHGGPEPGDNAGEYPGFDAITEYQNI